MRQSRLIAASLVFPFLLCAYPLNLQPGPLPGKNQFYAGYTWLSNSFNNHADFPRGSMNGWDAAVTLRALGSLGVQIAGVGYYGNHRDAIQHEHNILVAPQFTRHLGTESEFVHGLIGLGFINSGAIAYDPSSLKSDATLSAICDGGLDTRISHGRSCP